MKFDVEKVVPFENPYYKAEWTEYIPSFENGTMVETDRRFRDGNYILRENGEKVVYDGAQNYCGTVTPDGSFLSSRGDAEVNEYDRTFLQSAKEN